MEREAIRVVHLGQASLRYQALTEGTVDACTAGASSPRARPPNAWLTRTLAPSPSPQVRC